MVPHPYVAKNATFRLEQPKSLLIVAELRSAGQPGAESTWIVEPRA
jgi:hypothetical protein